MRKYNELIAFLQNVVQRTGGKPMCLNDDVTVDSELQAARSHLLTSLPQTADEATVRGTLDALEPEECLAGLDAKQVMAKFAPEVRLVGRLLNNVLQDFSPKNA